MHFSIIPLQAIRWAVIDTDEHGDEYQQDIDVWVEADSPDDWRVAEMAYPKVTTKREWITLGGATWRKYVQQLEADKAFADRVDDDVREAA